MAAIDPADLLEYLTEVSYTSSQINSESTPDTTIDIPGQPPIVIPGTSYDVPTQTTETSISTVSINRNFVVSVKKHVGDNGAVSNTKTDIGLQGGDLIVVIAAYSSVITDLTS